MDHATMTEDEERARKRVAIGLAPQRPTAKAVPLRPPPEPRHAFWRWWPVFLLMAMAGATVLLITAKVLHSPTQWTVVRQNLHTWFASEPPNTSINSQTESLQLTDDFNNISQLLAAQQQPDQWLMQTLPQASVYRMIISPSHVAWSTLGVQTPASFKLEMAFALSAETPDGYGGVLGRYQNSDNFYFFVLDGQGRFQVQLRQAGILSTLQPWTALTQAKPAGQNNVMTLIDNTAGMSLYINEKLAFETRDLALPPGQTGVVGGASDQMPAQIDVDWLKLYRLPE